MGLFDFFKDPDVEKMQHNNDVTGMIKALKHNKTVIRAKAAKALGNVSDECAIDPLIKCLSDQSWDVQINAAKALACWSSRPNLPPQAANKISSAMSQVNRPLANFYEAHKAIPEVFSEIQNDLKAAFEIVKRRKGEKKNDG